MPNPTLKDIARKSGVSVFTVSEALNGRPGVRPDTRARVLRAARELDYRPNLVARSLVSRKTHTIGVGLFDIANAFFAELVDMLEHELRAAGYDLLLALLRGGSDRPRACLDLVRHRKVDGLVCWAYLPEEITERYQPDFPVVWIGHTMKHFHSVAVDRAAGTAAAVRYLYGLGHRAIGYVSDEASMQAKVAGYRRGLEECGLPPEPEWVVRCRGHQIADGHGAALRIAAERRPVTAWMAGNDLLALGMLRGFADAGLAVPGDVSVVGFDHTQVGRYSLCRLTTINHPKDRLAREAVQLLLRVMDEPPAEPVHVMLDPELVPGESAGPPPR